MYGGMVIDKEIFYLARQRFLDSCKLSDEAMEAAMDLNRELNTFTPEEMFKRFTI